MNDIKTKRLKLEKRLRCIEPELESVKRQLLDLMRICPHLRRRKVIDRQYEFETGRKKKSPVCLDCGETYFGKKGIR